MGVFGLGSCDSGLGPVVGTTISLRVSYNVRNFVTP